MRFGQCGVSVLFSRGLWNSSMVEPMILKFLSLVPSNKIIFFKKILMQGKICDNLEAFRAQLHPVLLLLYKVISNHHISIPKHFLNYILSLLNCFSMKSEFNAPISSHGLPTTLCRAHRGSVVRFPCLLYWLLNSTDTTLV